MKIIVQGKKSWNENLILVKDAPNDPDEIIVHIGEDVSGGKTVRLKLEDFRRLAAGVIFSRQATLPPPPQEDAG